MPPYKISHATRHPSTPEVKVAGHGVSLSSSPSTNRQPILRKIGCMAQASSIVLSGMELRSEVLTIRYPDRYMDPRGARMWHEIMSILGNPGGMVA